MARELKPEVQKRLEKTVMDVFSNSDFHRATMRAVAKKAGISFGTIYKRFGSKEKLLFAFVDISLGKLTERIVDHLQGIEDLKEKLRKVFWLQLDYYERHPELGRILFMTVPMKTWMADESFQQRRMIGMLLEVLSQGQAQAVLNPGLPTGVLLDFMMGFVQRTFFMWVARGQRYSLARESNRLFEMVWRAVSNPDPPATLRSRPMDASRMVAAGASAKGY
jgi:AcrR family transcriptional regulator